MTDTKTAPKRATKSKPKASTEEVSPSFLLVTGEYVLPNVPIGVPNGFVFTRDVTICIKTYGTVPYARTVELLNARAKVIGINNPVSPIVKSVSYVAPDWAENYPVYSSTPKDVSVPVIDEGIVK